MKQIQILFSDLMVRALLRGDKTCTRRLVKLPRGYSWLNINDGFILDKNRDVVHINNLKCPYGKKGDTLWVRETWRTDKSLDAKAPCDFSSWPVCYAADGAVVGHGSFHGNPNGKTRVSIHMPRWASRIDLEVIDVRVERLHDINEEGALAEGVDRRMASENGALKMFYRIWRSIYGEESWDSNPWVWVVDFKILHVIDK